MIAPANTPNALSLALSGGSTLDERHVGNSATGRLADGVGNLALYRLASMAGMGSAAILLVNAAKRGGLIPTTDLTQLLAPLAEILALGFIIGLFFAAGRRSGLFGLVAFVINFVALASLEGVEVVINLIFSKLPMATVSELLAGPLGLVLLVSSVLFLIGSVMFVVSLFIGKEAPCIPLALYLVGAIPIALRAFVPEFVLDLGLAVLAVGIAWLAIWLWMRGASQAGSA